MFAQVIGREGNTTSPSWPSKPLRLAALLSSLTFVSVVVNSLIIFVSTHQ